MQSPPILNPVKIESPRSGGEVAEQVLGTPPFHQQKSKFKKSDMLVTPVEETAEGGAMAEKGVKSAANAELYAFYQSLIP